MEENNFTETSEHRETERQRDNKENPGSDGKNIQSDDRQVVEQRDEVSFRRSVRGMWQSRNISIAARNAKEILERVHGPENEEHKQAKELVRVARRRYQREA